MKRLFPAITRESIVMNKLNRATKKHILVLLGRFLDPSLLPRFISIDDMDHTFWAKLKKNKCDRDKE